MLIFRCKQLAIKRFLLFLILPEFIIGIKENVATELAGLNLASHGVPLFHWLFHLNSISLLKPFSHSVPDKCSNTESDYSFNWALITSEVQHQSINCEAAHTYYLHLWADSFRKNCSEANASLTACLTFKKQVLWKFWVKHIWLLDTMRQIDPFGLWKEG